MTLLIYSYNPGSEGAKLLKDALGIQRIKNENSRFVGGPTKTVINWGSTEVPMEVRKSRVLNPPNAIRVASNKLSFFQAMTRANAGKIIPPYTTESKTAMEWIARGDTLCARTILNGHSAAGLVVLDRNNPREFTKAPLYTKYIFKDEEYRVHIAMGEVIDIQRKVLRKEVADEHRAGRREINWKVRNLDNGFIYQKNNIHPHGSVIQVAQEAMRHTGLDFGAVDVIWSRKENRSYVLEINTAPGLAGTTVDSYAEVFRRLK